MAVAFTKYENFVEDLVSGVHQFQAAGHTCKLALTNTAPNVATHEVLASITEITEENGYTKADVTNDISRTGGTVTVLGTDVMWTASGGSFGPFRYVVLYNDTPTSPADPLIGYWDYGSSITINDGETFTWDEQTEILTLT